MTLPLILALQEASEEDRGRLLTILEQERELPEVFPEVVGIIERYDGFVRARRKAEETAQKAMESLILLGNGADKKTLGLLAELSTYILNRSK